MVKKRNEVKNSGADVAKHMTILPGPEQVTVDLATGQPIFPENLPLEERPEEDYGVADGKGFNPN